MSRNNDGLPMLPPWLSESDVTQTGQVHVGYEAPVQNLPHEELIEETPAAPAAKKGLFKRRGAENDRPDSGSRQEKRRKGRRRDKGDKGNELSLQDRVGELLPNQHQSGRARPDDHWGAPRPETPDAAQQYPGGPSPDGRLGQGGRWQSGPAETLPPAPPQQAHPPVAPDQFQHDPYQSGAGGGGPRGGFQAPAPTSGPQHSGEHALPDLPIRQPSQPADGFRPLGARRSTEPEPPQEAASRFAQRPDLPPPPPLPDQPPTSQAANQGQVTSDPALQGEHTGPPTAHGDHVAPASQTQGWSASSQGGHAEASGLQGRPAVGGPAATSEHSEQGMRPPSTPATDGDHGVGVTGPASIPQQSASHEDGPRGQSDTAPATPHEPAPAHGSDAPPPWLTAPDGSAAEGQAISESGTARTETDNASAAPAQPVVQQPLQRLPDLPLPQESAALPDPEDNTTADAAGTESPANQVGAATPAPGPDSPSARTDETDSGVVHDETSTPPVRTPLADQQAAAPAVNPPVPPRDSTTAAAPEQHAQQIPPVAPGPAPAPSDNDRGWTPPPIPAPPQQPGPSQQPSTPQPQGSVQPSPTHQGPSQPQQGTTQPRPFPQQGSAQPNLAQHHSSPQHPVAPQQGRPQEQIPQASTPGPDGTPAPIGRPISSDDWVGVPRAGSDPGPGTGGERWGGPPHSGDHRVAPMPPGQPPGQGQQFPARAPESGVPQAAQWGMPGDQRSAPDQRAVSQHQGTQQPNTAPPVQQWNSSAPAQQQQWQGQAGQQGYGPDRTAQGHAGPGGQAGQGQQSSPVGGQWQTPGPHGQAGPPSAWGGPPSLDNVPLRRAKKAPNSGWRKAVHHASRGAINPGLSAEERRLQELVARIRQPVRGDYRIAVLSLKGGVGKTTTTMGLGSTFASIRGDRVIAVDANPDFGTLSQRVPLQTRSTVRDLLLDPAIQRYSDVRRHTSQSGSRLEVLASERDPAASEAFSEEEYRSVARILQRFYNIILTDCGTGLMHSAMAGVLDLAHSLVLISSPAIDGARSAAATLDWLSLHGHDHLVRNAVVVINSPRAGSPNVGIQQLREYFLTRCRAVHIIPFDPHMSEGAEIDLARLQKQTKRAYVELAATVADDFATDHRRYQG
uniref:nucleotide-binding protein n=1 Tax=Nocardia donostiensis TaxID=1538463 RepID=UPI003183BA77